MAAYVDRDGYKPDKYVIKKTGSRALCWDINKRKIDKFSCMMMEREREWEDPNGWSDYYCEDFGSIELRRTRFDRGTNIDGYKDYC